MNWGFPSEILISNKTQKNPVKVNKTQNKPPQKTDGLGFIKKTRVFCSPAKIGS